MSSSDLTPHFTPSDRCIEIWTRIKQSYDQLMKKTVCPECESTIRNTCSALHYAVTIADDPEGCPCCVRKCMENLGVYASDTTVHRMPSSLYSLIQGLINDGDLPRVHYARFDESSPYFVKSGKTAHKTTEEESAFMFLLPVEDYEMSVESNHDGQIGCDGGCE